jgi:hemolysin III
MTPWLISKIPNEIFDVGALYLFGLIGHLVASATLHLIPWKDPTNFRKLDHAMIFVYIYSSYHATITTVIPFVHPIVIYFLNIGTGLGIFLRVFFTDLPPMLIGVPYVMVGWSILLDPVTVIYGFTHVTEAANLCLLMGLIYTIGAGIYILRWPNPCPRYMGFHEIFHVFSIIGSILLTYFVFGHCLPYYENYTKHLCF